MEKVYSVQNYYVRFDMGNPVDINVWVSHYDRTILTRAEIIEEAIGYAKEIGIKVTERELYDIDTFDLVEKKE